MLSKKYKKIIRRAYVKLIGSHGTIYATSMGVAIGLFCSIAIPFFQFVLAIILAFILRANKALAVLFTFFSNPYTTPFLYPAACLLGAEILGLDLTFDEINQSFKEVFSSFSFDTLSHIGWKLLLSYIVGGPIMGVFFGIIGYFGSVKLINDYKVRRTIRRNARIASYKEKHLQIKY